MRAGVQLVKERERLRGAGMQDGERCVEQRRRARVPCVAYECRGPQVGGPGDVAEDGIEYVDAEAVKRRVVGGV